MAGEVLEDLDHRDPCLSFVVHLGLTTARQRLRIAFHGVHHVLDGVIRHASVGIDRHQVLDVAQRDAQPVQILLDLHVQLQRLAVVMQTIEHVCQQQLAVALSTISSSRRAAFVGSTLLHDDHVLEAPALLANALLVRSGVNAGKVLRLLADALIFVGFVITFEGEAKDASERFRRAAWFTFAGNDTVGNNHHDLVFFGIVVHEDAVDRFAQFGIGFVVAWHQHQNGSCHIFRLEVGDAPGKVHQRTQHLHSHKPGECEEDGDDENLDNVAGLIFFAVNSADVEHFVKASPKFVIRKDVVE
mmetsp:Transcript_10251/g.29220  ORF Transcript_10251/g.29220 Transcript_10251/m.29220 type:complete len:301 (-) Transcript_10251:3864-4766(-)